MRSLLLLPVLMLLSGCGFFEQPYRVPKGAQARAEVLAEISSLVEQMNTKTLPSVRIMPHSKKPQYAWSSKIGGPAYWLKSEEAEYPKDPSGKPMHLAAQLNLRDMPALEGYPSFGLLQFFISAGDLYGSDFDPPYSNKKPGYAVRYHETVLEDADKLVKIVPKRGEDDYLPISGEYSLTFALEEQPMTPTDYRFEKLGVDFDSLSDDAWDYLYSDVLQAGSRMGGYSYFTQGDPRGWGEGEKEEWVMLFQMDSHWSNDDGVEILWGDAGVANWFIRPKDLEAKDFSKVWYTWDCH